MGGIMEPEATCNLATIFSVLGRIRRPRRWRSESNMEGDWRARSNPRSLHQVRLVDLPPASPLRPSLLLCHVGTSVLHVDPATHQTCLVNLKLEQCNGIITWSPALARNYRDTMSPGLKLKYTSNNHQTITYLDEGFIDITILKIVEISDLDLASYPDHTRDSILATFGTSFIPVTLIYGTSFPISKSATFFCPMEVGRAWVSLLQELLRQLRLTCNKLRWLKEQYLFLFYQEELCMGPLAVDAIKVFGGRNWSVSGMSKDQNKVRKISHVGKMKKKSYGNIHYIKDRGIHEISESPLNSPVLQRRSLACPAPMALGSLLASVDSIQEEVSSIKGLRAGSITHGNELSFTEFLELFKSFSLRLRKDLRNLFKNHAVSSRRRKPSRAEVPPAGPHVSYRFEESLTRISQQDVEDYTSLAEKRKIFDALALASILHNYALESTSKDLEIPLEGFLTFLSVYQGEEHTTESTGQLIARHEPDPGMRARGALSFQGFANYLMDTDNSAIKIVGEEQEMIHPFSHYFIASSHNSYLTGHQLKGQSSVELYRQILLTGCRCVELDCWDGEDGLPVIFHGHTLTTKISFLEVVRVIERSAFIASPYPVILSIENHCSLAQQKKMAAIFKDVLRDKLLTLPLQEKETTLPSPEQLKYKIIIKNKKLRASDHHTGPTRSSFEDEEEEFDSDFDEEMIGPDTNSEEEEEDDEVDGLNFPLELITLKRQQQRLIQDDLQLEVGQPNRTAARVRSSTVDSPMLYQRRRAGMTANVRKKKKIQVARELSDLVVYCQSTKFKDFKGPDRSAVIAGSPLVAYRGAATATSEGQQAASTFRNCYSINENRAKSVGRKWPLRMQEFTEQHLVRCYPVGMRIDSSNFSPVPVWAVGVQMVALNYQTSDLHMLVNSAFFAQNGGRGYVLKPSVMRSPEHILHRRFNPFNKELVGLHSMIIELTVVSGQYVCQQEYAASPVVEVEVLGIPTDCYKFKTKMSPRNSLNPIWEDTFEIEIKLPELAFLRFTVMDIATSVPTAQQVIPVQQLRPGYRNVSLCDMKGQKLPLSALFILSVFHLDSLPRSGSQHLPPEEQLQRKRMSFLVVHDVGDQDPYAILKVTSESTAQDVIRMALEKIGKTNRMNEFVLVEEVGGPKEDQSPAHITQRLVGMEENPLCVRSQWKADGKFVLRRVGEDPSWRARLMVSGRERRISTMPLQPPNVGRQVESQSASSGELAQVPELQEGGGDPSAGEEVEVDTFLVCIFNVSPGVAHTILRVPRTSTATDVIVAALNKSRRSSNCGDPKSFVLVEETETMMGLPDPRHRTGSSGKKQLVQRLLSDDENVYLVQSSWGASGGKLTLLEREKNLARLRALDQHPSIRETQSDPCPRSSISGAPGSPRMRRPNNLVGRVRRFSRSLYYSESSPRHLEVVSDGDLSEDDDDAGRGSGGRKSSIANFRKLKIW